MSINNNWARVTSLESMSPSGEHKHVLQIEKSLYQGTDFHAITLSMMELKKGKWRQTIQGCPGLLFNGDELKVLSNFLSDYTKEM